MVFSIFMLPPAGVAAYYGDGQTANFLTSAGILFVIGALIYLPLKDYRVTLRLRDGFLVVALFWVALGFAGGVEQRHDVGLGQPLGVADGQVLSAQHPFLATPKTRSWIAGAKSAEVRNLVIKGVPQ